MSTLEIVLAIVSAVSVLLTAIMRGTVKDVWGALSLLAKQAELNRAGKLAGNLKKIGDAVVEGVKSELVSQPKGVAKALTNVANRVDTKKTTKGRPVLNLIRGLIGMRMGNL